ncbi:MAG: PH domain-containing protein [Lachnospiraceae bacterium]
MTEHATFIERKRLLFFGLPWTFTKYFISEHMITIQAGLLNTKEDDCYMYKVQDVQLNISLFERLFKLGTIKCYTGDTTNSILIITHIKNAREIKNYILEVAEKERMKRRTLNTLDIGSGVSNDMDRIQI